jgi:uncharacterized membrane protein YjdF
MFWWYFSIPLYSFFIMMMYAALMGRELLVKYAVGEELILFEEYLIICAIAFVFTTIRIIYARVKDRRAD